MKKFFSIYVRLLFVALGLMLYGCTPSERSSQEIFEKDASGVVMLVNQYYYRVDLDGDENYVYFTGLDADGDFENLCLEEEDIQKQTVVISGTGFFISDDGKILTNRHVAQPSMDKAQVKKASKNFMRALDALLSIYQESLSDDFDELERQKRDCYGWDYWGDWELLDESTYRQLEAKQEELRDSYKELEGMKEGLAGIDLSDMKIELISNVYAAYHNTFVTNFDDMHSCIVQKVSEDESVDLAVVQLKSKETPAGAHVFDMSGSIEGLAFYESEPESELNVGRTLYMIGYNAGFAISNTKIGIQAQIYQGSISQAPDGQKVLYSIPSLPGSSGSPVVDGFGRLVAVNFAGLNGTQSFNYGIPVENVKEFLY